MPPEPKTCVSCGRRIEWRKKWAATWDDVRYCSAACRKRKVGPTDLALEQALRDRLGSKPVDVASVARAVAATLPGTTAAELDEPARRAARRLVDAGEVEIVQAGRVVDPSTARGPIQVRRARS